MVYGQSPDKMRSFQDCFFRAILTELIEYVKLDSRVTSARAFFFDLCRLVLENVNGKCKHNHFLLKNTLINYDVNVNRDTTREHRL